MGDQSGPAEPDAPKGEDTSEGNGGWAVEGRDDDLLAQLVAFAGIGLSVGVTLTVGGSVITGNLCNGKEYIEHIRDSIVGAGGDDLQAFLEPYFADRLAIYDDQPDVIRIAYVHLRDAVIFNGAQRGIPTNRGVFWRGRLDAIDGWCLGTISDGG